MSPETTSDDTEKQIIAQNFQETVEKAVAPVQEQHTRPIYLAPNLKVEVTIRYGSDEIQYMLFDRKKGGITGIQGLDFVPTYGVQILTRNSFSGVNMGQVMFGLKDNGGVVRAITLPGELDMPFYNGARELDLEEARAITDYISAPHLNFDQRETALRLTATEEQTIAEAAERDKEAAQKLQKDLDAIAKARRAAQSEAHRIIIS